MGLSVLKDEWRVKHGAVRTCSNKAFADRDDFCANECIMHDVAAGVHVVAVPVFRPASGSQVRF